MAVSVEYFVSKLDPRVASQRPSHVTNESRRTASSGTPLEIARWELVALGAGALYLFLITTVFWSPVWLLVFAPFVLLGVGRLMGLRSLWNPDHSPRG